MSTGSPVRERGGCLTVYLLASVVFGILAIILLLTAGALVTAANVSGVATGTSASLPVFPLIVDVVGVVVAIAGVYGAWTWKKWGIYAIGASFAISAVGNILNGNFGGAVLGVVIEAAILWYLVKDKWALFEG